LALLRQGNSGQKGHDAMHHHDTAPDGSLLRAPPPPEPDSPLAYGLQLGLLTQSILNSVTAEIAVLAYDGTIVLVNAAWQRFAEANRLPSGELPEHTQVGANYLHVCSRSEGADSAEALATCHGIQAVLDGSLPSFSLEYPCHSPTQQRWFSMVVTPVQAAHFNGAVVAHTDITSRKLAELTREANEAELALAQQMAHMGSWYWDLRSGITTNSQELHHIFGRENLPALGDQRTSPYRAVDWLRLQVALQQTRESGEASDLDLAALHADGTARWLHCRAIAVRDEGQAIVALRGTVQDITERKHFELAQKEAATVFASSYEGIMVVSPELRITKVNPAFCRITGYTPEEVVGQSPRLLSSGRHETAFYKALWSAVHSQGYWSGEIWDRRKNGEIYAALMSISAVRSDADGIEHYVGVFSDMSKFKAHELELERAANYDPLTGAPNRRMLADRLAHAIRHSQRQGRSLAVCFVDLDNFKTINDSHGHRTGDRVLVGVAENLKRVLRADDTLARIGGDEFVLLLADIDSPEELSHILTRVLQAVNNPLAVDDQHFHVGASIGVSLYPDDNADADTLLRHADQAMYQAKESGKNRFRLFDLQNDQKAQNHRSCIAALREALEQQQFELHYQPKIDLQSGRVVGAEALLRWRSPERGLVAPAEFLPHIYGSDLETPLGDWVIRTALAQAAAWHEQGLDLCVSANVSARHLLAPGFAEHLAEALQQHTRLPPASLELEVLESAAIADIDLAVTVLTQCRNLGVRFALDDFGTGYSSLTYLRRLPVDTLKIDQSFVRAMLEDADDHGIVESVIRLGESLRRAIVAEGVETLCHGNALLALGCRLAQGYGIAHPMPAGHLPDWLAGWMGEGRWPGQPGQQEQQAASA